MITVDKFFFIYFDIYRQRQASDETLRAIWSENIILIYFSTEYWWASFIREREKCLSSVIKIIFNLTRLGSDGAKVLEKCREFSYIFINAQREMKLAEAFSAPEIY